MMRAISPYHVNRRMWVTKSISWCLNIESIDETKVEIVDSRVLEHLLEHVSELQKDLEEIIRELIPVRHEGKQLPEAIDLDNVLRKLKVNLTVMISRHQKIMQLMKEDDTKFTGSDHSGSAMTEGTTSIKLPKLNIPKPNSMETFSIGEYFGSSSGSQFIADSSCQMLRS